MELLYEPDNWPLELPHELTFLNKNIEYKTEQDSKEKSPLNGLAEGIPWIPSNRKPCIPALKGEKQNQGRLDELIKLMGLSPVQIR